MEKQSGWIEDVNHGGDCDGQVIDGAFDNGVRVYSAILYRINGFTDSERSSEYL